MESTFTKRLTSQNKSKESVISLNIGEIILSDDLNEEEGRSRYLHALFHIPTLLRDNFNECRIKLDDILKQYKSNLMSIESEVGSSDIHMKIKDENPVALQVGFSSGQLAKDIKDIIISKEFREELGIIDITIDIQLI